MLIGENYKLESDSMNITLLVRRVSKKGKENWWAIGYFSTPQNALKFLADIKIRESGFKDLQTIVKAQKEIHEMIENATLKLSDA